jgi:hypothetical protein
MSLSIRVSFADPERTEYHTACDNYQSILDVYKQEFLAIYDDVDWRPVNVNSVSKQERKSQLAEITISESSSGGVIGKMGLYHKTSN